MAWKIYGQGGLWKKRLYMTFSLVIVGLKNGQREIMSKNTEALCVCGTPSHPPVYKPGLQTTTAHALQSHTRP